MQRRHQEKPINVQRIEKMTRVDRRRNEHLQLEDTTEKFFCRGLLTFLLTTFTIERNLDDAEGTAVAEPNGSTRIAYDLWPPIDSTRQCHAKSRGRHKTWHAVKYLPNGRMRCDHARGPPSSCSCFRVRISSPLITFRVVAFFVEATWSRSKSRGDAVKFCRQEFAFFDARVAGEFTFFALLSRERNIFFVGFCIFLFSSSTQI